MAITLSEPSPELAERLTSEVAYENRIVGVKVSERGGQNPLSLYSLAEAANFIYIDDFFLQDKTAIVGYLDPSLLARWVTEVFEDEELAGAIRDLAAEGEFYGEVAMPIKELLDERLAQCQEVLAKS